MEKLRKIYPHTASLLMSRFSIGSDDELTRHDLKLMFPTVQDAVSVIQDMNSKGKLGNLRKYEFILTTSSQPTHIVLERERIFFFKKISKTRI